MTKQSDIGAHSYHQGTTEKSIRAGLGKDDFKKGSGAKTFLIVLIGIVIGIMATTLGYAIATRTTDETTTETSSTNCTKCNVKSAKATDLSDDYIYIPEWGVKFKKPEGYINYLYDDIASHNKLVFWAAPKGTQASSLSGYESYVHNKDGLLTVSAVSHEDYDNTMLDVYWGEKIFENDKYVFVRNHAQAIFSEDEHDIESEKKASDLLIELTDSISNI